MIYVDTSLSVWLRKTGLKVSEWKCPVCKEMFFTTVPFLQKDYYGLQTPIHGCGGKHIKIVITPRTEVEKLKWKLIRENM